MSKYAHNVVENALSFNDDERSIVHVITDETINRYGQIVRMDGIDTTGYDKNPVVFFNHYSDKLPIGRNMWHKNEMRNGVKSKIAKTQFHDGEEGTTIYNMWKDKFLNASSIGFGVIEMKPYKNSNGDFEAIEFTKTDLGEYSIVGVPANKNAVRNAVEKYGNSGWIINSIIEESEKEVELLDKVVSLQSELNSLKSEIEIIKSADAVAELRNSITEIASKIETMMVENLARDRKEKFNNLLRQVSSGEFSR
jgi:HK97 family phage prohead protease